MLLPITLDRFVAVSFYLNLLLIYFNFFIALLFYLFIFIALLISFQLRAPCLYHDCHLRLIPSLYAAWLSRFI